MEKPQFVTSVANFAREKAPAIALALVVGLGSAAIIGEDGASDQNPGEGGMDNPPDNGQGDGLVPAP